MIVTYSCGKSPAGEYEMLGCGGGVCARMKRRALQRVGRRLFSACISHHQRSQRRSSTASRLSTEDGGERALLRAGVRVGESTGESSHVYVLEIECEIVSGLS
jgi:hypothetical protein